MTIKLLTEHHLELPSLKGGCTGLSESSIVKMPHCWKSNVMAHLHWVCLFVVKLSVYSAVSKHVVFYKGLHFLLR